MFYNITDLDQMRYEASGIHKLDQIKKTPLLILKSSNDPIIQENGINEDVILQNENIILAKTKYGGHLGFYESFLCAK